MNGTAVNPATFVIKPQVLNFPCIKHLFVKLKKESCSKSNKRVKDKPVAVHKTKFDTLEKNLF